MITLDVNISILLNGRPLKFGIELYQVKQNLFMGLNIVSVLKECDVWRHYLPYSLKKLFFYSSKNNDADHSLFDLNIKQSQQVGAIYYI